MNTLNKMKQETEKIKGIYEVDIINDLLEDDLKENTPIKLDREGYIIQDNKNLLNELNDICRDLADFNRNRSFGNSEIFVKQIIQFINSLKERIELENKILVEMR